jgi:hypothetical protein
MRFERDSFLRCYVEAWFLWLALNMVGGVASWLTGTVLGRPVVSDPFSWIAEIVRDPVLLLADGILVVSLLAAILVGSRRSFRRTD